MVMKRILLLALVAVFSCAASFAQSKNFWSSIPYERAQTLGEIKQNFEGITENLFQINTEGLKAALANAPQRGSASQGILISIPNLDGKMEHFRVFEASNFEPELQAQFPEIRAYAGYGVEDPTAVLRMSVSPRNVQTMVLRADKQTEFIEPFNKNATVYAVFSSSMKPNDDSWTCLMGDTGIEASSGNNITGRNAMSSDLTFRTYRLAISCNGEYAQFHGGTVADALAGMNATMTRVNGVYEKDLAVRLQIVANNNLVIFTNPASDPYGTSQGSWDTQLKSTLNNNIGSSGYDIGHLFAGSGGGGNAGCIGCICDSFDKGTGYTAAGGSGPEGDNFDIDYVAHEMGHQLGAFHTFSYEYEGSGVNVEPGSGSTIMGYAGITPYNVQLHSDDYFTYASIQQIQENLAGKTCGTETTLTNPVITINAGPDYSIPKGTPFILKAVNAGSNGTNVTYTWEQNDDANPDLTGEDSEASPTKQSGPTFRSFPPSASPNRYMPTFSTVLANDLSTTWESVSNVVRTLNFTLTGRDNAIGGGQTKTDAMRVFVRSVGPFRVTSQNLAGIVWTPNTTQTITWNVAGTTANNINTANVNILLSTDGGATFNTVLASNTPNDGSETITVPNVGCTQCRIMVEAVGNIFYALNSQYFSTTLGTDEFSLQNFSIYPNPNNGSFTVQFDSETGSDVNITVHDIRDREIFTQNYANQGVFSNTINLNAAETGIYLVTVNDGANKVVRKIVVN
jgi:hypothetical protein